MMMFKTALSLAPLVALAAATPQYGAPIDNGPPATTAVAAAAPSAPASTSNQINVRLHIHLDNKYL